jgi:hypothetical protein
MYGIRVELWKKESGVWEKVVESSRANEKITRADYDRVLEALGPPTPIVGKKYIYLGPVEDRRGEECIIRSLGDFEKTKLFTSNVEVQFEDNAFAMVPVNKLRLP